MNNPEVLMLGPDYKVRGGISSVVNIYFSSEYFLQGNVIFIATHVDGNRVDKLFQFIKSIFLVLSNFRRFKEIKIVHIHCASNASFYRKSFLLVLAKFFRKKTLLHIHGAKFNEFFYKQPALVKSAIKKVLSTADVVIALSESWKADLLKICPEIRNIGVVNNPVLLPRKRPYMRVNDVINILFMGRLGQRKGVYDLITAAKDLIEHDKRVRFFLCGDGEVLKARNLVTQLRISEYFTIPGWIKDKESYLGNADIFVLPSYNEGFPMSILEAFSYSLPVISTSVGGIPEIVDTGLNGFLVPPGDVNELRHRLLYLVDNPAIRRNMGENGFAKVSMKFNARNIVEEIERIYRDLR